MKKYISLFFASLMMCSCVDTIILPNDRTVEEDFWQTKSDVELMVNGAYKSMIASGVIQRLITWGSFHSDELVIETSISASNSTRNALYQIQTGNIETTNTFSDWSSLYSVINNCNLVIDKAGAVVDIDPAYTEGDYLAHSSQMKALRALCYYYLVRTFRDVPYSSTAYTEGTQDRDLPQTPIGTVIDNCIKDLEEALPNALAADAYMDWKRTGYINRDAIRSILADIYLWRGSMTHSESDYQQCVNYCDEVIQSKKQQNAMYDVAMVQDSLLYLVDNSYREVFVNQNSMESIFELQFDGTQNANTGLCQLYYKYGSNTSVAGYMKASGFFSTTPAANGTVYESDADHRRRDNCYDITETSATSYDVRKMIATTSNTGTHLGAASLYSRKSETRTYSEFAQNFIIYRISDVMLMKAEALVQLAPDDADNTDANLMEALSIVQSVARRSFDTSNTGLVGSTVYRKADYNSKSTMEDLVLRERLLELCFEGKRWFDLMRYNYRHMELTDIASPYKTLAELNAEGFSFGANYDGMLTLLARKNSSNSTALKAKTKTEPSLYMPVLESQIKANPNLVQNPAYNSADEYVKK